MERQKIPVGNKWEPIIGFSRAIRVGNHIFVSGTVAVDKEGNVVGINDPHKQTVLILKKIEEALKGAGATLQDVVRTRIYTTNIDYWDEIGRAHGEFFSDIRPASTIVEVQRLITEDLIVEIEAEAI